MIKVLIGVSGIGKSHYAQQIWDSNSVIISRDKLREMLWGHTESNIHNYYDRSDFVAREKDVTKYQDELVYYSLSKGMTVILDNTHLKLKYINDIKKKFYYTDIEFIDVAKQQSINVMELRGVCNARDKDRVRQVGDVVINYQIRDYQQLLRDFDFEPYKADIQPIVQDKALPKAICVDLDGTTCIMHTRGPFEWDKVGEDLLNTKVFNAIKALQQTHKIIICTGRDGIAEQKTKEWLKVHNIQYDDFYIRNTGDVRKDYIVKEEMWKEISKRYYIDFLIDDRWQVTFHARLLGLTVFDVAYHTF